MTALEASGNKTPEPTTSVSTVLAGSSCKAATPAFEGPIEAGVADSSQDACSPVCNDAFPSPTGDNGSAVVGSQGHGRDGPARGVLR